MGGHTLNITSINRVHMGAYRCMANNGIPPSTNQTFYVEVHCKCALFFSLSNQDLHNVVSLTRINQSFQILRELSDQEFFLNLCNHFFLVGYKYHAN